MAPALALLLHLLPPAAAAKRLLRSDRVFSGRLLQGRYELQKPMHGSHLVDSVGLDSSPSVGEFPWGSGPASPLSHGRYSEPEHVGKGAYGDTWKAFDRKEKKEVAIKIFYGGLRYYTKGTADEAAKKEAEKECSNAQAIHAGRSSFPEGQSHVCRCFEAHLDDQHETDDVLFLVLEYCGANFPEKLLWLRKQEHRPPGALLSDVRHWMRGILMAIRFMSGLDEPMSHGDLHADNVVVSADNEAKLVDFGYARKAAFDSPWGTDVFGFARIYAQALCGGTTFPLEASCMDGSEGIGEEEDWEVVKLAYRKESPEELMTLLP